MRTIIGVATSIAAFVGRTARGPEDEATTITSFAAYERKFGGLSLISPVGFAVRDFFLNGGTQAVIVRLYGKGPAGDGKAQIPLGDAVVILEAASAGVWGQFLRATIDFAVSESATRAAGDKPWTAFNLTVREATPGGAFETFRNVSLVSTSPRFVEKVLLAESDLVRWKSGADAGKTFQELTPAMKAGADALIAAGADTDAIKAAAVLIAAAVAEFQKTAILRDVVTKAESGVKEAADALKQGQIGAVGAAAGGPAAVAALLTAVGTAQNAVKQQQGDIAKTASDGETLKYRDYIPDGGQDKKTGLYALEATDLFNLLCLPFPSDDASNTYSLLLADADAYCVQRRAMLLVDPPASNTWKDANEAKKDYTAGVFPNLRSKNAALYFPRVRYPNPLRDNQVEEFPPCGVLAGLFAKTDAARGVWKAPAGLDATLTGVSELAVKLTDLDNGLLNPLGINCLRSFPAAGRVVWGARTLRGDDQLADDYKYVPVRRLALFLEESLYRGTKWAVFEPNDEPLWAQLRLNVGSFLHDLFRQGAFAGKTPSQAYLVKCDKETTTQSDINKGIVNVLIGFAPLKPAEFVVLRIQQLAGTIDT